MTQAVKVYQIADALGMDYETVVAKIRAFGIHVNNKMSRVEGDVAEQIKSTLLKEKQQDWIEIEMGDGIRKRVRKNPPTVVATPAVSTTSFVGQTVPVVSGVSVALEKDAVKDVSRDTLSKDVLSKDVVALESARETSRALENFTSPKIEAPTEKERVPSSTENLADTASGESSPSPETKSEAPVEKASHREPIESKTETLPASNVVVEKQPPASVESVKETLPETKAPVQQPNPEPIAVSPETSPPNNETQTVEIRPEQSPEQTQINTKVESILTTNPVPENVQSSQATVGVSASNKSETPAVETTSSSSVTEQPQTAAPPTTEPSVKTLENKPAVKPEEPKLERKNKNEPNLGKQKNNQNPDKTPASGNPNANRDARNNKSGENKHSGKRNNENPSAVLSVSVVPSSANVSVSQNAEPTGGTANPRRHQPSNVPPGANTNLGTGQGNVNASPNVTRPPTPSTPPPKRGVTTWDPVNKVIHHIESPATTTPPRRVHVDVRPGSGGRNQPRTNQPSQPQNRPNQQNAGNQQQNNRQQPHKGGPGRPNQGGRNTSQNRGPAVQPSQMAAHKRVVKIEGQIALQELARRMSVKASEVLLKLLGMGMPGVNINSTLDSDTAKLLAQEFQYEVDDVALPIDQAIKGFLPDYKELEEDIVVRPPVVTVMGHVDHGKTTLLDAILGMRVAESEAGGITQKVSAYRVETKKGPVVFFDTPGHEAFTKLRARGAETTDVAVLVVAADDGVMPTTVEAINHAKAAKVPIVVALNKMDKADAKPERVLQQLMSHDVVAEQFGGEVLVVKVSAKQRTGIDELVETLALQSEILDLRVNPKRPGKGTVFDATLDKGRGVVARLLVRDGTIRAGDVIMAGTAVGKIRAMFDDRGKAITKAGPSMPIEVLGLNEVPAAGEPVYVVADTKKAQAFADEQRKAQGRANATGHAMPSIESLLTAGESITVGVIIKAEAQASVEALSKALTELSTDKVKVATVHTGIGGITESDINLAVASKAVVVGFNVRPQGKAGALAESEKVQVRLYDIIYEAVEDMKALMVGQLKPTFSEKSLGKAEVRQVFHINRVGQIAGSHVIEGLVKRTGRARLVRDSVQVWDGKIASLRHFKTDVKEMAAGYDCGIGLENYNDMKPGDIIEVYELEEVAAKL